MKTVSVREAKTRLSKLIDEAVKGNPFVIARAGKLLVKVTALNALMVPNHIGFLEGGEKVSGTIKRVQQASHGAAEIESLSQVFGSCV